MHFHQAGFWLPLLAAAALSAQTSDAPAVTKYKLYDVGAFGGNFSGFYNADSTYDNFSPRALNAFGQLAGSYSTSPVTAGSFFWSPRKSAILPNLPNGGIDGSNAFGLNNEGLVVGAASTGQVDQQNGSPYYHAVLWTGGTIHDLGDLGGFDSWANYVTNPGLVVGYAYNTLPDLYSAYGTQYHATTWTNGKIRDLGTLGGSDSEAWAANDSGSVIGISFTNNIPIPPFGQPQLDAFIWSNGTMTDLGNLGGVFSTPAAINASGEVAVIAYDSTNQYFQSYLWANGSKTILETPGGNFNEALMLNDAAVSVGAASELTDTSLIAAVWGPQGHVKSIGTLGMDSGSIGFGINRHNVVVGGSGVAPVASVGTFTRAFVWQNGTIKDLNTLIPAGSPLVLNVAYVINEAGVIAGSGTNTAGEIHAFVLVPVSTADVAFETAAAHPAIAGSSVTSHAFGMKSANTALRSRLGGNIP